MIRRVLYRFFAVYLGLFAVASQFLGGLILFPGFSFPALGTVWPMRPITEFIGSHVFGVTNFAVYGTSADTAFHWVLLSWLAVVAAAVAVATTVRLKADTTNRGASARGASARGASAWVVSGFRRTDYWFRTFLRFALAAQMFYFGMAKVIPAQFPPPNLVTLVKPFGDLAPDDLLWDFIGSSLTYQIFTGVAEVAAGVLLVVPKTAVIGAIIAFADMLQVFVLNMSYDVGLKQTSSHLMLIALFLLWPDLKRLGAALVAKDPSGSDRPSGRSLWLQIAFGMYLLAMFARLSMLSYRNPGGAGAPKSPLYGIWNVERMSMDGEFRSPILNDYDRRWRRVIFDTPDLIVFQRFDDSFAHYGVSIDIDRHVITLRKIQSRVWQSTLTFERRGDDGLILDGEMDAHPLHVELRRLGMDVFKLTNGGFRWVRPPG